MQTYYALIIDIVDSKKLSEKDRFNAQVRLRDGIELVEILFKEQILKAMNFSGGDSVQGLFVDISAAYKAFLVIENALFPYEVRAGIGGGEINQEILKAFNDDNSNTYDGKAYHFAQEALLQAKKSKHDIIIKTNQIKDEIINPLLSDKKLTNMTLSRGLVYSIINLISPICEQTTLSQTYFSKAFSIVDNNLKLYLKNSRVEYKEKNKRLIIRGYLFNENFLINPMDFKISSDLRTLLVRLTESKSQNINSLIKTGNMEYLRERAFAKAELLKLLY